MTTQTGRDGAPAPGGQPLVQAVALDHANLHVRDVEASLRFYAGTLGLTDYAVLDRDDQGRPSFVQLRVGQQLVFLRQRPDYRAPADARQRGLNHICLRIEPTDPERLQEALRARGTTIRGTRVGRNPPTFSVYVEDPDGHGVELEQDTPAR
jgi:glyoxylase I family protein